MRIWIESRVDARFLAHAAKRAGMTVSRTRPDVVITYGGDGTILDATRAFSAPIMPLRRSAICSRCAHYHPGQVRALLTLLQRGRYHLRAYGKIEARVGARRLIGLNDVQLHNADPRVALRFAVTCGSVRRPLLIGDGLVAATAFGSTAYYEALGYAPFSSGYRVGFNNTKPRPAALRLKRQCVVTVLREHALVLADNDPRQIAVRPGQRVIIRPSREKVQFVEFVR